VTEKPKGVSEFPLRPVEVVSVLVALGLVVASLVRFALVIELWDWWVPVAVVAGLVAADFVSGVVHWAGDTWGSEATPWLGLRFIRPFRFHHAHPLDMLRSNFFTTNGDTALTSLPFLVVPFVLPLDTTPGRVAAVFLWAVGGWGMWTSQFHRWAHTKSPPRIVAWLQRRGLILSPRHHHRHHKSPYAVNYCITTGWCDPVLSRVRFFPTLEWLVSRLTGWQPRSVPG
jgi:ubiquitin-conjugating enzyme E2 variant